MKSSKIYKVYHNHYPRLSKIKDNDRLNKIFDIARKCIPKFGLIAKKVNIDQEDAPYRSNYFDLVFCGSLIELIFNPDHLLKEINRILIPNGHMIITFPNHCAWLSRMAVLLGFNPYYDRLSIKYNIGKFFIPDTKAKTEGTGFVRLYSHRSFKAMMRLYNFETIQILGAKHDSLPKIASLIDSVLCPMSSLAFQEIFVVRK